VMYGLTKAARLPTSSRQHISAKSALAFMQTGEASAPLGTPFTSSFFRQRYP